jgi:hypothetical protein
MPSVEYSTAGLFKLLLKAILQEQETQANVQSIQKSLAGLREQVADLGAQY